MAEEFGIGGTQVAAPPSGAPVGRLQAIAEKARLREQMSSWAGRAGEPPVKEEKPLAERPYQRGDESLNRLIRAAKEARQREAIKAEPGMFERLRQAKDAGEEWWTEVASKTLPGMIPYLAYGVQPEEKEHGLAGRAATEIASFAADPLTWTSGLFGKKVGEVGMRLLSKWLGEKGLQKVEQSALKRLALKAAVAAPSGATTLGTIEAVKNPVEQLVKTGKYDPLKHLAATSKSTALGAGVGLAGSLPLVALPAEVTTLAMGEAAFRGELPNREDWENAAFMVGGFRLLGTITGGLKASVAEGTVKSIPKNVAKSIVEKMNPTEGMFVVRAAKHAREARLNEFKYSAPEGTDGRYIPKPASVDSKGKPADGTKWIVYDIERGRARAQADSFMEAGARADDFNLRKEGAPSAKTVQENQAGLREAGQAREGVQTNRGGNVRQGRQDQGGAIREGHGTEAQEQIAAPRPSFREFAQSKGAQWPIKTTDPQYKALKAEFDLIRRESPEMPPAALGGPDTPPKPTEGRGAAIPGQMPAPEKVRRPAQVVRELYERHRDVIEGEEPGNLDAALAEEANVETALRPGYSFKQGFESQANELRDRLPQKLRQRVRVIRKGSPNYAAADGQDVFATVGTDAMADSIVQYHGRNARGQLLRVVEFAKQNPEMFTPEEHHYIKNYEQERSGDAERIKARRLNAGDTFEVNGEQFVVESVDESGRVKIADGVNIDVPKRGSVLVDKGTLKEGEASAEFEFGEKAKSEPPYVPEGVEPPGMPGEAITPEQPREKFEQNLLGESVDVTKRGAAGQQTTLSPQMDEAIAANRAETKQRGVDREIGQLPLLGAEDPGDVPPLGITSRAPTLEKSIRMTAAQAERAADKLWEKVAPKLGFKPVTPEERGRARRARRIEAGVVKRARLRASGGQALASMELTKLNKDADKLGHLNSAEQYRIHRAIVGQIAMERLPEPQRKWAERVRELQDDYSRQLIREVVFHFGPDSKLAERMAEQVGKYLHESLPLSPRERLAAYAPRFLRLKNEQFLRKRDRWRVNVGSRSIVVKNESEAKALRDSIYDLAERTEGAPKLTAARRKWVADYLEEGGVTQRILKEAWAGGKIRIKRPLTEKERLDKGFSRDPVYAASMSIAKTAHNLHVLRLARRMIGLAKRPPALVAGDKAAEAKWAASEGLAEITASPKWVGDLHGRYLRKRWAKDINRVEQYAGGFERMVQDYIQAWKTAKVIYNPATHMRNLRGNVGFAFIAGISPWNPRNWKYYYDAVRGMRGRDATFRNLLKAGTIGGEYFGNEVYDKWEGYFRETPDAPHKAIWKVLKDIHEGLGKVYNAEDQLWKMAHAKKLEAKGMRGVAVAHRVNRSWPNYAGLPSIVKKLTRKWYGAPFLAFNYEAMRIYGNAALTSPVRMMLWNLWPKMLTAYTVAQLGIPEHIMEFVNAKRSTVGPFDFEPLLPRITNPATGEVLFEPIDERGRPKAMDLRFEMPLGNEITELSEGRPVVVFQQPGVVAIQDLLYNKDRYTRKEIYDEENDEPRVKLVKMLKHLFVETAPLPSWAPSQHGYTKVKESIQGLREDTVLQSLASALFGVTLSRPYVSRDEAIDRIKTRALLDDKVAEYLERLTGKKVRGLNANRMRKLLDRDPIVQDLITAYNESYRSIGGTTSRVSDPITTQTIVSALTHDVRRIALFEQRLGELKAKEVSGEIFPGERAELKRIRDYLPSLLEMMNSMQGAKTPEEKEAIVDKFDKLLSRLKVQMPETERPERALRRSRRKGTNPLREAG